MGSAPFSPAALGCARAMVCPVDLVVCDRLYCCRVRQESGRGPPERSGWATHGRFKIDNVVDGPVVGRLALGGAR